MSISSIIPLFQYLHEKKEKGHLLHDTSGDIRILLFRYYSNISAAVRRWVLLDDAISSGISHADPRAAAQSSTVVYCCFIVVSRAILWIYNHSQCRIRYIM